MRVAFFGSSPYCLPVLEALNIHFDLTLVVTRPDKPVGRKKILTPSTTKLWAEKNGVLIATDLSNIPTLQPLDLGLVADFGSIIPEEVFSRPKLGTFNVHFSKLPDLRGASPVQSAILRGDSTAWVTIFKLEKTLDTGPILWQKDYPINPDDTAKDLYTRLFQNVAKELPTIFLKPETWNLIPQQGTPTFCKKLSRDDGFVPWEKMINEKFKIQNYNRFRAMFPWPGLWTLVPSEVEGPRRMKILKCHLTENKLVLDEVQFEGEKPRSTSPNE